MRVKQMMCHGSVSSE